MYYSTELAKNITYPAILVELEFVVFINTTEIPGELLRRNMISSLVNITCNVILTSEMITVYGYEINCAFHS